MSPAAPFDEKLWFIQQGIWTDIDGDGTLLEEGITKRKERFFLSRRSAGNVQKHTRRRAGIPVVGPAEALRAAADEVRSAAPGLLKRAPPPLSFSEMR